ncbi:hypothetical protein C0J08_09285 [Marinomonas sp. CT5]|uniref:S41 family peptidase n=1 Tax=Marinomonas sp. CT5 TaxID=2066133 RepID=UPI001BAEDDB0|nr:S41 family peptidase [Marinomonas sp. CT5]QUX95596.1 hypothetical protein C0J08_09285 [Marinomonas sp. CT5]
MRYYIALIILGLILLSLSGCQSPSHKSENTSLRSSLNGIWQSNGYGYLLDIQPNDVRFYDITEERCQYNEEGSTLFSKLAAGEISDAVFKLKKTDRDTLIYIEPFETYPIEFMRLGNMPHRCLASVQNDPKTNFEFFADYMQTHYAFFKLYGVDWQKTVHEAKSQVDNNMSDVELFNLFSSMLKPLKDAHLALIGDVDGQTKRFQPDHSTVSKANAELAKQQGTSHRSMNKTFFKQYKKDIRDTILKNKGEVAANGWIQYGVIDLNNDKQAIGYLALMSTYNYAGAGVGHDIEDRSILMSVLDDAIDEFNEQKVKAVIIDLSVNVGGYSFPAIDLANRFAAQQQLVFYKLAYDARDQNFFPEYVAPEKRSPESQFHGPVYLLSANTTVSGGEEVVLALRALPNVTHFGENTRGALSDILTKTLPNGWTLDLSNEIYIDFAGNLWEGDGIPPDYYLQVFDPKNPFDGHVEAVDQVIHLINNYLQNT